MHLLHYFVHFHTSNLISWLTDDINSMKLLNFGFYGHVNTKMECHLGGQTISGAFIFEHINGDQSLKSSCLSHNKFQTMWSENVFKVLKKPGCS